MSRSQGTGTSNFTIASVTDSESSPGSLTVTATMVPAGLTVSNIVNNSGTVSAYIAASCAATTGNNTIVLQVSDGSHTTTGNLVINVTGNSAPVLTYNNPAAVTYSSSTTVNPATASDNGAITGYTLQSQGTYTGAISVNSTTGAVSISNAAPVGMHTITIRATDNCGATTDWSFSLTVNGTAEIAVEQPAGTDLIDGTASVSFGSVQSGSNADLVFTINSVGTADLTGLGITIDGTDAALFTVTANPTAPITPGGSTTFTVRFAPTSSGSKTASVHIASNDADENPFDITITGTGLTIAEAWRLQYFGSPANTGNGADTNDFDFDGLVNLLERAFGTDPTVMSNQFVSTSGIRLRQAARRCWSMRASCP